MLFILYSNKNEPVKLKSPFSFKFSIIFFPLSLFAPNKFYIKLDSGTGVRITVYFQLN